MVRKYKQKLKLFDNKFISNDFNWDKKERIIVL